MLQETLFFEIVIVLLGLTEALAQSNANSSATMAVVNPHNFKYTILETEPCQKHDDVFLLTVVHTAAKHYRRRMLIRETWGNQLLYSKYKMVVVFFLGMTDDHKLQESVEQESTRYHDIIQEDFHDSYKNLTYKQIMWLKWGGTYCPKAQYTLKVDDDIMVNIFGLMNKIIRDYRDRSMRVRSIFCVVHDGMTVIRVKDSKWYVSKEEYDSDSYSRYCSGSAFLLTQDLLLPMYENSLKTRFFWVDDFYATGLLPKGLNVTYHDRSSLYSLDDPNKDHYEFMVMGYRVFSHLGNIRWKQKMWRGLLGRYNMASVFGVKLKTTTDQPRNPLQ